MTNYIIAKTDSFNPSLFPEVVREVTAMNINLEEHETFYKSEIVISFLKDHCIQMERIAGNKQLIKTITSAHRSTVHLESLFNSCRENKTFLSSLEKYIQKQLTANH